MRKNMILGIIGFALALVSGGQVFAALGPNDISMGTFAIPLPGCAPEVTISDEKDANGCYTMTIQNKTLQDGACSSSGINPTTKQVCDGRDGVGGNCESKVDVTGPDSNGCYTVTYQGMKVEDDECVEDGEALTYTTCDGATEVESETYIPYPLSQYYEHQQELIDTDELGHEGYRRLQLKFKTEGNSHVLKFPDHCEEGENANGERIKKCIAQGNATNYANSDGTHNPYLAGDTYTFVIGGSESGYPRYEYTAPRSVSGSVVAKGFTQKVYAYTDGRRVTETGAIDECKEYAKPDDQSARVTKCTVQSYQYPETLLSMWVPNTTKYCLGDHSSDCNQYTIPVGAVDACAGLTPSDAEWETTVNYSESDYTGPDYNTGCTTNCSGTSGFKTTKEVMCNGNVNVSTQPDRCSYASGGTVQCASGYAYQTCTPRMVAQDGTGTPYSGCFEDTLGGLYARRSEIVPVSLAADTNNLYYCKIADCDSDSTCWIGGNKANGPNPDATTCWGTVSITGLTGDAGPGCSFIYNGTKWQTCCWVTSGGAVDTTQSPTCTDVTGDLLNQLNNWMCKPTYTTYYIDKQTNGNYTYSRATAGNDRLASTVGIRTTITNCDGTNGGDVDVFDGPAGDDYDPCDGVSDADALSTVSRRTTVYVHHGSTNNSTTTTGIGYYTETNVMCDTSGNKIVKRYDKCDPVSLASGASRTVGGKTCSGNQTLLMCTPQEGDLTPYPFCSDAEASGYPKKKYFAPTGSDGKITKEGYTALVHKYTSSGNEVPETNGITLDKCDPAIKKSRNANDTATVVKTVSKCTVQDPGTTGYAVGSTYCLNLDSGENCDDYLIIGEEDETYSTQYISPTGTNGKLTVAGYTCRKKTFTRKTTSGSTVSTVEEECQKIQDDTCHKAVKHTRTSSNNIITMAEKSLLKCEVQTPGNTSYTTGTYYCLNLGNGENCNDYVITGDESEQSHDEYVAPTMSNGVPTTVGYLRTSVTNSRLAAGSQTYYTNERKDPGRKVYKGSSSTIKYTVQAPGAESGTFVTGTEYCIGISIEACAEYRDDNPCAGVDTAKESTTVQKVIDRTYTRAEGSQGSMVSTYKMCDNSTHTESTADECKEVPTPDGQTCANGVWMQCKRQADEGTASATARGTTYGYCATYPQCVGNENSTTIVKKTERAYTAPTKTGTNSYYDTPGKMVTNKIPCNSSASAIVDSSEDDQCEEIPNTGSICPANKVLKSCKRKGDESATLKAESTYNLCTTGTSIFDSISENDPCGGDTTSDNAKKKVKSIQYEYVTPVSGTQSKRVGYSVKTTTMCNPEGNTTEYIYDTCEPLAASDNCKSGTTYKPYYKCHKQMYDATSANASNREYNACDPLSAAVALSSAVANKLDSDVEFKVKPNSQDNDKDYITISGSNIADKPIVALESLQGQSVFDIWKEEQTIDTQCQALFGKNCSGLTTSDMLLDLSAQGNWARSEYGKNPNLTHDDLGADNFQDSLKPCKSFDIQENTEYSGSQDGKEYVMTCVE